MLCLSRNAVERTEFTAVSVTATLVVVGVLVASLAASAQAGNFCARNSNRGHAWDAQSSSFVQTPQTISGLSDVLGSGGNCAAVGSSHIWVWDCTLLA